MSQYFENDSKLKSEIQERDVFVLEKKFLFYTDHGVFSKKGVDYGSRLLLESLLKEDIKAPFLDVGCGVGILGIVLNKVYGVDGDLIDVNRRAIHLTKRNIKANNCVNLDVFESNCYSNITKKYHLIITNPPIRAGKKIVYTILEEAKEHLFPDGVLYFVVRKEQGAKSILSDMIKKYDVTIIERKKGFFIVKCKNRLTC